MYLISKFLNLMYCGIIRFHCGLIPQYFKIITPTPPPKKKNTSYQQWIFKIPTIFFTTLKLHVRDTLNLPLSQ